MTAPTQRPPQSDDPIRRYRSEARLHACHDCGVSAWGRATFGDPCRECGYAWPEDLQAMIEVVRRTPNDMRGAIADSDGQARHPDLAWDARSYVCHVVDNLRIWAERLVGATYVAGLRLRAYDGDALAQARAYEAVPVEAALWSLTNAVDAWIMAVDAARAANIALLHPDRGRLHLIDVASTNAHDAHHHVFDVRRSVV